MLLTGDQNTARIYMYIYIKSENQKLCFSLKIKSQTRLQCCHFSWIWLNHLFHAGIVQKHFPNICSVHEGLNNCFINASSLALFFVDIVQYMWWSTRRICLTLQLHTITRINTAVMTLHSRLCANVGCAFPQRGKPNMKTWPLCVTLRLRAQTLCMLSADIHK